VAAGTRNVIDHDGLTAVDLPWHRWVVAHRTPVWTDVMTAISFAGQTAVLAVVAVIAAGWLAFRGRKADAALVIAATGGAALLVPLLKHLVARGRPPVADRLMAESSWSYPSGHSLGSTAVLGVLAVVVTTRMTARAHRVLVAVAAALVVVAIGVSRVYLGVHWPSDVLAGWLVGGLWLALCVVVTGKVVARCARPAIPSPGSR
jgi:undecaprenyl-diphosphatase